MEKRITLGALAAFACRMREEEKSAATVEKYLRDVRHFFAYLGKAPLEKAAILAYKAKLGRDYAPAAANSMLAGLNAFLRFAGWDALCVKQFKVQKIF